KSAEAPGHLKDAGSVDTGTTAIDASHGQGSDGSGKNAEAPGHLKDAGSADSGTTATDASHGQGSDGSGKSAEAPGHLKDAGSADHGAKAADTSSSSGTSQGGAQATDASSTVQQTDKPTAPIGQVVHANSQNQVSPHVASVDAAGNLVFSSDSQHAPAPSSSHSPADIGEHTDVGLVGLSDHGNVAHHFDLHW
ncbi:hypothetical protein QWZ18_28615, partial [Methylobacterium longum]|nr:hypothetical protein [Methylobacterium longum]